MPRQMRDANLEARSARFRLRKNVKHWRTIHEGLAIGYRRGDKTSSWYVRVLLARGRYTLRVLGTVDDHAEADGKSVFSYQQAQRRAHGVAERLREANGLESADDYVADDNPLVGDLLDEYLDWHKTQSDSWKETEYVIEAFIRKSFGNKCVQNLERAGIQRWLTRQARADSDDPEAKRRRRATANRRLTVLKAALNYAYHGPSSVKDAWREVKPYRAVDAPRVRFLSEEECQRLINAAAPDLRALVRAALMTGARYGELTQLIAADFDAAAGTVTIQRSKSGKGRHIPLTYEGVEFFCQQVVDKKGDQHIFCRTDEREWRKNHQVRPMKLACEAAKIEPAIGFHILRHTYGSLLARQGTPLQVIAEALGHADSRMTERHYAHLQPNFVADTIRNNLPNFGIDKSNVVPVRK